MGRRPRAPSQTGYYHVVTRGNRRQPVFQKPRDYAAYCRMVRDAAEDFHTSVSHFCLMPNHVHLLLYAPELHALSKMMHHIQRRYWWYVQRDYEFTGHFWQGRFHSFPIEDEAYLLQAARYIERNPLEANLITALGDYPWSSYRHYAFGQAVPLLVAPTPAYEALSDSPRARQAAYRQLVEVSQPYDRSVRRTLERLAAYA